ncbi:TRAP transporter small permease [Citricoccus sp. GCM10030269]|uniref:TRAP transporter small permease n=1 Tax=Citricoccus sp. GCM10030269 TaxID=3273388 RepID=UPI00361F1971
MIETAVIAVSRVFGILASLAVVVVMLAIALDVVTRWITGASLPSMVEISESALVVSIFLGLPWAAVTGAHVSVSLLTDRLGQRAGRVVATIAWTLCSLTAAWFTWTTCSRALASTGLNEVRMGLVQWPLWPLRWVIAVGFLVLTLACVVNLLRINTGRRPFGADGDVTDDDNGDDNGDDNRGAPLPAPGI